MANCSPFKSSQLSGLITSFEYILHISREICRYQYGMSGEGEINKLSQQWCYKG